MALIVLPATILLISLCAVIVVLSSPKRGVRGARAGPPKPHADDYYGTEDFSDGSVSWMPVTSTVQPPIPLLHLALQRIAELLSTNQKRRVHLERLDNLDIKSVWQESTGNVERDADPEADRWYRWIVVACFYDVDGTHGRCETLDVRTRSEWRSGKPPTQWPFEYESLGVERGPLPTTGDALLIQGPPPTRQFADVPTNFV